MQTLLYATVFMSAVIQSHPCSHLWRASLTRVQVVLVVFFGAKQNKAARHENLMFAQLIA